jgi:4-hydroxybenzoate polyprenyltransferase
MPVDSARAGKLPLVSPQQPRQPLFARILGFILGAAILAVAFVFSLVIFSILLAVGLLALAYAWWRTRRLRASAGRVIEGESRRELTPRDPD